MEKVWNKPRTRAEGEPLVKTHAHVRSVERYGLALDLPKICRMVRSGNAKFVAPGKDGCATYDVPHEQAGVKMLVRVHMSADKTFVITVLPPKFNADVAKAKLKERAEREGKRNRDYFKRFQNDDEELVTAY